MTDKVRLLLTQALSLLDPMEPVPIEDLKTQLQDALVAKRNLEDDIHIRQIPHPTVEELKRKVVLLTEEKEHYRLSYIAVLEEKTRLYDRIQLDAQTRHQKSIDTALLRDTQTKTESTPTHTRQLSRYESWKRNGGGGLMAMAICSRCGGSSITNCGCPSGVWVSD